MALDVHVAASEKRAESKRREMFIDEELHELLFTRFRTHLGHTKVLASLANYYGDHAILGEQVGALAEESRQVASQVSDTRLSSLLLQLASLCDRASSSGDNIYLFGD